MSYTLKVIIVFIILAVIITVGSLMLLDHIHEAQVVYPTYSATS